MVAVTPGACLPALLFQVIFFILKTSHKPLMASITRPELLNLFLAWLFFFFYELR